MDYRTIPGTDLNISIFGFGNFVFGTNWWGDYTDEQGVAIQNHAFDKGVNFFDPAPAYGNGRAENLLAQTINDTDATDTEIVGLRQDQPDAGTGFIITNPPNESGSER